MKKHPLFSTLALLGGAVSVLAQGQVAPVDGPQSGGSFGIQVFQQQTGSSTPVSITMNGITYTGLETMGSSGNTTSYSTSPGSATYAAGSALSVGYDVQLLAGPTASTLSPAGPIITGWFTGDQITGYGGFWEMAPETFIVDVPSVAPGSSGYVEVAVWDNEGGTVNTMADALQIGAPWGVSSIGRVALFGGGYLAPTSLPTTLESFSLATVSNVPEPTAITLGMIGATTLLFRRRK